MNRDTTRRRIHARGSKLCLAAWSAAASVFACTPNLDGFSTQFDANGAGAGGATASAGSSGEGDAPSGGSAGSGGNSAPSGASGGAVGAGAGGMAGAGDGGTGGCAAGTCAPICSPGFADCNAGTVDDGCETDVTTLRNCGACNHACSNNGASGTQCTAAHCVPTCRPNYGDCNVDTGAADDDGCETYLASLTQCGTCASLVACDANQVCNSGVCGPAQGVVAFSVPLTATGQDQRYADRFPALPNLANASLTIRLYAPGATGGALIIYLSDADFTAGSGTTVNFDALARGWSDVHFNVGGVVDNFDPSAIAQVNFELTSGATAVAWTNPTVLYVDSVLSSNFAIADTFDSSIGNMVTSTLQSVTGSTMTWSASVP